KARAAAKKREKKRRGADEGEGSHPKVKRKKTSVVRGDGSGGSKYVSSLEPLWIMNPTETGGENPFGAAVATTESREDRLLLISPHDSANYSAHDSADAHGNIEEGESSPHPAYYVPKWFIYRRCRVDTPMWCRELMVHMAPPAAQEDSNALNNATALERAWFALGRGALAQANMLERFENLQADYDKLAKTHAGCEDIVRQLIDARAVSQQNSKLYLEMSERFKKVKNDHAGCTEKIQLLEDRNSELSQVNKNQALRIKKLEDTLAKKDSALVYAERINAERAQEKEKLVTQLSKTEMEKFDCIRKLLPTVVNPKGLSEERFEKDLLELMSRMEGFDAYADKKMYVYPDFPPSGQAPPSKPSSGKTPSSFAPKGP
ncbi:hypothetical protein Tco_0739117, partial [Tanacetum coccineum]